MYMSIVCEKCNHVLSKTIITGHLIHEIAAFITKILPYLPKTKTVTDDMATKIKNMGEDALVVSANVILPGKIKLPLYENCQIYPELLMSIGKLLPV